VLAGLPSLPARSTADIGVCGKPPGSAARHSLRFVGQKSTVPMHMLHCAFDAAALISGRRSALGVVSKLFSLLSARSPTFATGDSPGQPRVAKTALLSVWAGPGACSDRGQGCGGSKCLVGDLAGTGNLFKHHALGLGQLRESPVSAS
jgi:hypothetical protein